MTRNLYSALKAYNGKAVSTLGKIAAEFGNDPAYVQGLIEASRDPDTQGASTWLIRDWLQQGRKLTSTETEALVKITPHLSDWHAQLHMAQMTRLLRPSRRAADLLASEMNSLLNSNRPFIRTWSMDAIAHLADLFPAHKEDAAEAIRRGLSDTAASVRTRAKALQ